MYLVKDFAIEDPEEQISSRQIKYGQNITSGHWPTAWIRQDAYLYSNLTEEITEFHSLRNLANFTYLFSWDQNLSFSYFISYIISFLSCLEGEKKMYMEGKKWLTKQKQTVCSKNPKRIWKYPTDFSHI